MQMCCIVFLQWCWRLESRPMPKANSTSWALLLLIRIIFRYNLSNQNSQLAAMLLVRAVRGAKLFWCGFRKLPLLPNWVFLGFFCFSFPLVTPRWSLNAFCDPFSQSDSPKWFTAQQSASTLPWRDCAMCYLYSPSLYSSPFHLFLRTCFILSRVVVDPEPFSRNAIVLAVFFCRLEESEDLGVNTHVHEENMHRKSRIEGSWSDNTASPCWP